MIMIMVEVVAAVVMIVVEMVVVLCLLWEGKFPLFRYWCVYLIALSLVSFLLSFKKSSFIRLFTDRYIHIVVCNIW